MTEPYISMLTFIDFKHLYPIYIPSYNRVHTSNLLKLFTKIPKCFRRMIYVVVQPHQHEMYSNEYPDFNFVIVNEGGSLAARLKCLSHAKNVMGFQRIFMLDDDVIRVQPLFRREKPTITANGVEYLETTSRYSKKIAQIPDSELTLRSLAVVSFLCDRLFERHKDISYGALRNDLHSNNVNTNVFTSLCRGGFPSVAMVFDLDRFGVPTIPNEFAYHGDDLVFFINNLSQGKNSCVIQPFAYTQNLTIKSQIPLDPESVDGRNKDKVNIEKYYPDLAKFLFSHFKNKHGAVKRFSFNWRAFCKEVDNYDKTTVYVNDLIY